MEITMDALWVGLIATSVIAFLLKYVGHSVPEKWLSHPRVLKINSLIPIALLSALVAVQTFTNGKSLVVDQRFDGLAVAVIALILRAPFAVVVLSAAATSAGLYHLQ
jgi:branched-subunit amino acid transport protein